ncbi:hypothetical protein CEXT_371841 [Caerostris extrusa]|uniref:Uncharacterized protein n=1 Tax=Caerostris extrusa TaxID=172846 RepID=A0AAV4YAB8_CAEEX|nr:hypothetical protein CEXT_371841 [Caerostris extrusa]
MLPNCLSQPEKPGLVFEVKQQREAIVERSGLGVALMRKHEATLSNVNFIICRLKKLDELCKRTTKEFIKAIAEALQ